MESIFCANSEEDSNFQNECVAHVSQQCRKSRITNDRLYFLCGCTTAGHDLGEGPGMYEAMDESVHFVVAERLRTIVSCLCCKSRTTKGGVNVVR